MSGKVIARGLLFMAALSYNIGVAGVVAVSEVRSGSIVPPKAEGQVVFYQVTPGRFVQTPFSFNLSSNVLLVPVENATAVAVMAASVKGSGQYVGSSIGGSMLRCDEQSEDENCGGLLQLMLREESLQVRVQ